MPNQSQSGNNHRRPRGQQRCSNRNNRVHTPKFQGETAQLYGYVYEIRQGTMRPWKSFDTVTAKIADYFLHEFDENGMDFRACLVQKKFPELVPPTPPTSNPEEDIAGHIEYEVDCKWYYRRLSQRQSTMPKAFAILLGQCSPDLRIEMQCREAWKTVNEQSDVVGLLRLIEQVMRTPSSLVYEVTGYAKALQEFFAFRQGKHVACWDYWDMFKDLVKTVLYNGGELGGEKERVRKYISDELQQDPDSITEEAYNQAVEDCRERFLAAYFLHQADPTRFAELNRELHNKHILNPKSSPYPKTLSRAYSLLLDYEEATSSCQHRLQGNY